MSAVQRLKDKLARREYTSASSAWATWACRSCCASARSASAASGSTSTPPRSTSSTPGRAIPIDPFHLTWKAREYGVATRFIELVGEVNARHAGLRGPPAHGCAQRPRQGAQGARVLVLGAAYQRDTDDPGESPGLEIMDELIRKGFPGRLQRPAPTSAAGRASPQHRPGLGAAVRGVAGAVRRRATRDRSLPLSL
jgi:hypothetical protein